jgi:hypothetical protein
MALEIFDQIEQGSEEWFKLRCGIPTASVFSDVKAKGEGKMRKSLLYKLAGEIITGEPAESYRNAYMDRGKKLEPEARAWYAMMVDEPVRTIGFAKNGRMGASPDALVGENGGLEIKTVTAAIMIEILERPVDKPPPEHLAQVQGNMLVTGRQWWDLVVYCCRAMPPAVFRIVRNPVSCAEMLSEINRFNTDVDALVAKIRSKEAA